MTEKPKNLVASKLAPFLGLFKHPAMHPPKINLAERRDTQIAPPRHQPANPRGTRKHQAKRGEHDGDHHEPRGQERAHVPSSKTLSQIVKGERQSA